MSWDPFDQWHSEGSFRPNVKKSEKSLEMGSRGREGQKSQKRVKNELKSLKKVTRELVFNSFLTFLPPPRGREAPGTHFEDFP